MTRSIQARDTDRQFKSTDMLPFFKSIKGQKPVDLRSLDIKVSVTGIYAETTQMMHFYNPGRRLISSELVVPLPDNAVVCGYALDIDGSMRDGVIVLKQEARKILEAEERKGADPGLVEQVHGNIYKIRIYPFPSEGTRTVSITYMTELTVKGNEAAYHLPLSHASKVEDVSVRVEVNQAPCRPEITGGLGNTTLTKWHQSWIAEAKLTKGMAMEDLFIRLPDLPEELVMVEKTEDGECFFCISTTSQGKPAEIEWSAKNIAIAWDASGSRVQTERDFVFLRALFDVWQTITVYVQIFCNRNDKQNAVFEIQNGDPSALLEFLENLPYDGATDLSALDFNMLPNADCEAWFLLSDGLDTVSGLLPVISDKKVIAINSSQKGNAPYLEYLADQTGGAYISLLQTKPQEAVGQICSGNSSLKILSSPGCEDISIRTARGRSTITGRLKAEMGLISLQHPDRSEAKLIIDSTKANTGDLVARKWAGQQIQKLALLEPQGQQWLDLARRFGIVSPGTSLLVLENIDQYIEYRVEPPSSLTEMRKAYWEAVNEISEKKGEDKKEHLAQVVRMWEMRVEWWERDYSHIEPKTSPKPLEREYSDSSANQNILNRMVDMDVDYSLEPMAEVVSCCSLRQPDDQSLHCSQAFEDNEQLHAAVATVTIKPWNPDTPYLKQLRQSELSDGYQTYLKLCAENKNSPSFFLDCGDHFLKQGQRDLGVRILSNLLEIAFEDTPLMRIYAWRLKQAGEFDLAIAVFERVLLIRDDEPQSHRDLALALGSRWERDGKEDDIMRAMQLLYEVASNEWNRFPEIELIALMELNRFIYLAKLKSIKIPEYIDKRLIRNLDLDLRISMSWDADLTDVDLHVFEPTGEHAYYAHNLTTTGGLVSRDFTQGYGPEEYVLRKSVPGTYKIKAHYFGSHQQTLIGPCTVTATVFTNYGRTEEACQVLTLRLDKSGDDHFVGEINFENKETEKCNPQDNSHVIEDFRKIKMGMAMDQVVGLVGIPDQVRNDGNGMLVLIYNLKQEVKIEVAIKYEVVSVRQIMNDAVIEIA